jgi:DNA-binding CsgD family transcriptional regulator
MIGLKNQDYGDFLDIIEHANACLDMDTVRKPIIEILSRAFHAEGAMFLLSDKNYSEVDGSDVISIGFDVDPLEKLPEYRALNPFYNYNNKSKYVVTVDDILSYSDWENHPFYNFCCRGVGIYHKIVLYLKKGQRNYGVICLSRLREQPNFSQKDKKIGRIVARLITTIMSNIRLLSEALYDANLTQDVGQISPMDGALLIDHDMNIIYYNLKAKECCDLLNQEYRKEFGVKKNRDIQIPAVILQDCLTLKDLFKEGEQVLPVSLKKNVFISQIGWVRIECQLIWQNVYLACKPCILVSFVNLLEEYGTTGEAIRKKYKLTDREIDIIECVNYGFSNNEISRKLFISQDTVETHLKHIFKKTGVKNRTSLTNLAKIT